MDVRGKRKFIVVGVAAATMVIVAAVIFAGMGFIGGVAPKVSSEDYEANELVVGSVDRSSTDEKLQEDVPSGSVAGESDALDPASDYVSAKSSPAPEEVPADNAANANALDPDPDPNTEEQGSQDPGDSSDNPSGDAPSGEQWTGYY